MSFKRKYEQGVNNILKDEMRQFESESTTNERYDENINV